MAHVYVDSAAAGAGTGADWANAYTTLAAALTAKAAGDNFWVAHNHAETQATAMTLTSPGTSAAPCTIMCVSSAGTVPPVSADLATTSTISVTGANNMTIAGVVSVCHGITFNCGSAANASIFAPSATGVWYFNACKVVLNTTSSAARINLGSNGGSSFIRFNNTTMTFGATGQSAVCYGSRFEWLNTASAIVGTVPTTLFANDTDRSASILLNGVDLSAATSATTIVGQHGESGTLLFINCKLGASVTKASAYTNVGGSDAIFINCDSAGTNYMAERYNGRGTQVVDTAMYRTGGASDGTTSLSQKITATSVANWTFPFASLPIAIWNDTTAANVTVTIEGLQDPRTSTSLPTNADVWMELSYMGSSATPIATINSGTKADYLASGSNLTASTQAWDSGITARANSTAYALGDRIKVATNSGRVFICTTAGTTAGSEPAGYASAVDGGAVTDSTATFTAAVRFKQAITLSSPQPAMAGPIYATVKVAKVSGIYYIDPKLGLS